MGHPLEFLPAQSRKPVFFALLALTAAPYTWRCSLADALQQIANLDHLGILLESTRAKGGDIEH